MNRRFAPLLLPIALAACHGSANINFDGNDSDGNSVISTDSNGRIQIKAPGIQGSITLPKMPLDAKNFDIDGVTLYPGSTLKNLKVNDGTGDKDGQVIVEFESPAAPTVVRDWFRDNMTKQGFKVTTKDDNLIGTTDDGQPFALQLSASGDAKTKGLMQVGR
ncbi:hypothetical protein CA234_22455 [Sphingomonas sp. ABOLE]|jgi:hypothetical protein|uniref:hypothetical protein n=1 Tax=Sphingomonas sp. ABOLE TaxID=1985878 RepID=UPI000F7E489E|nr:hypothetical protein [Sphingomonas sp. ABOLE]RSV33536.1 hypothetical protein CA234_22455 [Sphingomonas sp. ABOLE]